MRSYKGKKEFILKLKQIHPGITLISDYEESNKPVLIKNKYGICKVYPNSLIRGNAPSIRSAINPDLYFRNKIKEVNNNIIIKGEYINNSTKILIEYNTNFYLIKPNDLLNGHLPSIQSTINKTEYFIKLIPETYKSFYDCSYIEFKTLKTKVKIICPIHGEFWQFPKYILSNHICKRCSAKKASGDGSYNITIAERNRHKWKYKKAKVYFVEMFNNKETFYKIGITTTSIKHRFSIINNYQYLCIKYINTNLYDAIHIEKYYHRKLKKFKYTPSEYFGGHTECFTKII